MAWMLHNQKENPLFSQFDFFKFDRRLMDDLCRAALRAIDVVRRGDSSIL